MVTVITKVLREALDNIIISGQTRLFVDNLLKEIKEGHDYILGLLEKGQAFRVTFTSQPDAWIHDLTELKRILSATGSLDYPAVFVEWRSFKEVIDELKEDVFLEIAEWVENEEGIDKELVMTDLELRDQVRQATREFLVDADQELLVYIRIDIQLPNGMRVGFEREEKERILEMKSRYFQKLDDKLGNYVPLTVRGFLERPESAIVSEIKELADSLQLTLDDAFLEVARKYHITKAVEKVLSDPRNRPPEFLQVPSKVYQVFVRLKEEQGYIF